MAVQGWQNGQDKNGIWKIPSLDLRDAFGKLPQEIAAAAYREWWHKAQKHKVFGVEITAADAYVAERDADAWAWGFVKTLTGLKFDLTASDEQICAEAARLAARFEDWRTMGFGVGHVLRLASREGVEVCKVFGEQLGVLGDASSSVADRTVAVNGIVGRLKDERFWRRQLRRLIGRKVEQAMRMCGRVSNRAGLYASAETVKRRRQQKVRNSALLAAMQAVNELGQSYTLAELSALGVSNPAIRRAELMVRIAGFEEIAKTVGDAGVFFTLTCPSAYHKMRHKGGENPKYNGTTPAEAAKYLSGVWAKIRASLGREGIKPYGFRVAEPHHDGTPHWHGLMFMSKDKVLRFKQIVAMYGCREDRAELGLAYYETDRERKAEARRIQAETDWPSETPSIAEIVAGMRLEKEFWRSNQMRRWKNSGASRRVDFEMINWSRGSAAGYIAKYIAKNIDGKNNAGDSVGYDYESMYGETVIETAERVDAWASVWGIRQFQQVGGAPVSVWRELRRLDDTVGDDVLMVAARAADVGDWAKFVSVMGGVEAKRADRPLAVYMEADGTKNKYGEPSAPFVRGIINRETGEYKVSRIHEWTVIRQGGLAAPWTCVNNCTDLQSGAAAWYQPPTPQGVAELIRSLDETDKKEERERDDFVKSLKDNGKFISEEAAAEMMADAADAADAQRQQSNLIDAYRAYLDKLDAISPAVTKVGGIVAKDESADLSPWRVNRLKPSRAWTKPPVKTLSEILAESRREDAARREKLDAMIAEAYSFEMDFIN